MMDLILALLTWIGNQVGRKADTANSAGSLHAKIAELRATLLGKNIIYYGTVIKSIQVGTITVGNSGTSNTATIGAVTTSKAFVFPLGVVLVGSETAASFFFRWELTNSTTVTVTRGSISNNNPVVGYAVIEFY
ncbi:MAG: hypothetical protein ABFD08_08125 [Syntrophomonas sp.]